jgi:hypothetical protein
MTDCDTNTAAQVIIILFIVLITCYLQYIYCYLLHTHNFLFKVPWRWSCNFFFWSAGKFLPKYLASHSRTRIFPRHQSEPQISHFLYQFSYYTYIYIYIYINTHTFIISKLPTSFVATILNYAYGSNHNIIFMYYICTLFLKKTGLIQHKIAKNIKNPSIPCLPGRCNNRENVPQ